MGNNLWRKSIVVVGGMLLAYALIFAQGAWAGQNQKTKDQADSPQKAPATKTAEKQSSTAASAKAQSKQTQTEDSQSSVAEKPSSEGSHEGIKVHGHWTIEVRNADGSVPSHREFENSIFSGSNGGATLLSLLLSRQTWTGFWEIVLTPAGGGPPAMFFDEPTGVPGASLNFLCSNNCGFGDDLSFSGGGFASGVYTGGTLTLTGTAVVPTGFTAIGQVVAGNFPCFGKTIILSIDGILNTSGQLNPSACAPIDNYVPSIANPVGASLLELQKRSAAFLNFTSRMLDGQGGDPQPIPVTAGQTVAVTVIISFS